MVLLPFHGIQARRAANTRRRGCLEWGCLGCLGQRRQQRQQRQRRQLRLAACLALRALPRALPPKELLLKARVTAAAVGEAVSAIYHHAVADGIIRRGRRSPIGEPGRPPGRACEKTNLVGQRFANRVELLVRNVGAMIDRKWPDTGCLMHRNPTPLETFHLQDREPIHGYHLLSDFPFLTFEFSTH